VRIGNLPPFLVPFKPQRPHRLEYCILQCLSKGVVTDLRISPTETQPSPNMESAEELVIDTVVTKLLALIGKGPRDLSSEQLAFLKSHLIARDRFHNFHKPTEEFTHYLK
jgi:hypothetical protein